MQRLLRRTTRVINRSQTVSLSDCDGVVSGPGTLVSVDKREHNLIMLNRVCIPAAKTEQDQVMVDQSMPGDI